MAKSKTVIGADGREWNVSRTLEWSIPAVGDDFEHDLDGGRPAAVLVLSSLFLFVVVLVVWAPNKVYVPWWVILVFLVSLAFFPVRWVLRRPWTLVAQTPGGYDLPAEHWVGTVRGVSKAREEMRVITRSLRTRSTPAYTDGPLQPVS
jgi:hypothetical protein